MTSQTRTQAAIRAPNRRTPLIFGIVVMGALLMGCTSLRVSSDYDRNTTFANYHTYAWVPREHFGSPNPLVERRAHEAIESELESRGFRLAEDPGRADFVVDFTIGSRDRVNVQSYPVPYRGPWMWGGAYYGSQVDVRQYREGTLAIDVFDGRTHQPVWTGRASKELSRADQERSEGPIREAVTAVLAEFPADRGRDQT
jgi:hypothetical protein